MATIQERGGSYKITVSCGYDVGGKQVRRSMTWKPEKKMTPSQLEKVVALKAAEFEKSCSASSGMSGHIKLETFIEQWFTEYAEPRLKFRSIGRYRELSNRVNEAMKHLYVDKISTRTVQLFILNLAEDGINTRTGGGLSPKSIKNYLSFISSIFDYALKQGMIEKNPCKNVSLPSMTAIERDCYSLEEAQNFIELLESEPTNWRTFFTLAIYGGFRRGELFGLEWKDIDFESGVITIHRASLYNVEKGVFTDTPKTTGSYRSLKMPNCVITLLKQFKSEQAAEALQMGSKWMKSDRLFVSRDGKPMHPNRAQNWLTLFCKRTGMRKVNIHSFRHLNASLLIGSGADVKTVSSALGHSQTTTTLNIYTHTIAAAQARAADAIADVLDLSKKHG